MEWTRGQILGRGSTAIVSIVTSSSGDIFAVKSIELSQSECLQREQRFLSSLSNPCLISYKGCDITSENNKLIYNLLMEYAPGGTLIDAICNRNGRLHGREIANYTRQILQGLEYLHLNGIVHCDIKGRNILIGESGAKIADLGCAKRANRKVPLGGTPMFMAPEVARGEEQGFPADIWALGCTVIEMATSGGSPWQNVNDPMSILYRIAFSRELPEFPDFLSDQAKDFLSKCLRRDPKERWTAKQLLKHPFLEEFISQVTQSQDFITDSPTSILDQGIWSSMEEETEYSVGDLAQTLSPEQRIKQLAGNNSEMARWKWGEMTGDWITVRGNIEDDWKGVRENEGEEVCGTAPVVDRTGMISFLETNFSCCRCNSYSSSSSYLLMSCTCVENKNITGSVVGVDSLFDRQKQTLLDQYQIL